MSSDAATAFVGGVRELQSDWPELDEDRKLAGLQRLINPLVRTSGMPEVTVSTAVLDGERTGLFDAPNWTLQFQKRLLDNKELSSKDALDLAKTTWHEARHAEQYYLAARRDAASERNAEALFYRSGVRSDVMRAALANPVLGAAPDVTALNPRGYPEAHSAVVGACADAMRTALIANRDVRTATIRRLDAADTARRTAPSGFARVAADKAYNDAISAYTALPEERDAFDVEPLIDRAWAITQPQQLKVPVVPKP